MKYKWLQLSTSPNFYFSFWASKINLQSKRRRNQVHVVRLILGLKLFLFREYRPLSWDDLLFPLLNSIHQDFHDLSWIVYFWSYSVATASWRYHTVASEVLWKYSQKEVLHSKVPSSTSTKLLPSCTNLQEPKNSSRNEPASAGHWTLTLYVRRSRGMITKLTNVMDDASHPLHDRLAGQLISRSGLMRLPWLANIFPPLFHRQSEFTMQAFREAQFPLICNLFFYSYLFCIFMSFHYVHNFQKWSNKVLLDLTWLDWVTCWQFSILIFQYKSLVHLNATFWCHFDPISIRHLVPEILTIL